MKFHYVYQTKNNVNGKTYVGVHSTNNLNDGYMGSGVNLKQAFDKYGIENFETLIMSFFDTREEALVEEAFLVDENWVCDSRNYNVALGGGGGGCFGVKIPHNPIRARRNAISKSRNTPPVAVRRDGKTVKICMNISDAADFVNGNKSHVLKCLKGERKTHKGFTFERC